MTATLAVDDPILHAFAQQVGTEDPVAIEGGRSRWNLGGQPEGQPRLLRAPDGIADYQPEEMTVRVRAGTTVAELHRTLAERGQRTALPERAGPQGDGTVGGALAVGQNDIRALGRGRVRESLLQVRYVSAEGRIVNSGGPTVKNVSGFDLPRLMVGSLGTLGCLAEVILRTNPVPAVSRWLRADGVDPAAALAAVLAPSAVLTDGSATWVELEGHGVDVDQQQAQLAALGPFEQAEGPPTLPEHRWSLTPAEAASFGSGSASDPAGPDGPGRFVAALGLGLVFADRAQPTRTLDPVVATISERVKQNFDPTGRLNPGRQPGRE